jgi:hypothetical protein
MWGRLFNLVVQPAADWQSACTGSARHLDRRRLCLQRCRQAGQIVNLRRIGNPPAQGAHDISIGADFVGGDAAMWGRLSTWCAGKTGNE